MSGPAMRAGVPQGLGVYRSRLVREWSPRAAAEVAHALLAARVRHVALCAEAADGWRAPPAVIRAAATALREQAGVEVHVYSLPGAKAVLRPAEVAACLLRCGAAADAASLILDAEESYRRRGAQLRAARAAIVEGATERRSLGVTTYGLPSSERSTRYPWSEILGWGWLGWQCYERAAVRAMVRTGLVQLRVWWGPGAVVPHLASYERRGDAPGEPRDGARRLLGDLERTCLDEAGRCDVPGVWIWQDATLDAEERETLRTWAQRVGW